MAVIKGTEPTAEDIPKPPAPPPRTPKVPTDSINQGVQAYRSVQVVEKASSTTLPTDAVLYLSGLPADEDRLARVAKTIAREFDITPNYFFGDTDPKNYRDPITGERLNLRQAQRFTDNFAPVAVASMLAAESSGSTAEVRRILAEKTGTPTEAVNPALVGRIAAVLSREHGEEITVEQGIALAAKLARDGIRPGRLEQNFQAVKAWAGTGQTPMTSEQVANLAIAISSQGKTVRSIRDVQRVVFGSQAVRQRERLAANQQAAIEMGVTTQEQIDRLAQDSQEIGVQVGDYTSFALGPDYWSEVGKIEESIQLNQEAFANSFMGKALTFVGNKLNGLWEATEKGLLQLGTGIVGGAVVLASPFDPQGDSPTENWQMVQRVKQYAWQRIEGGDSVGDLVSEGFDLPSWTAGAFDFAVGWYVDPFVIGGKAALISRSGRVLPGTLQKISTTELVLSKVPGLKLVVAERRSTIMARQWKAWESAVPRFASSRISRNLFDDAYKGVTNMLRRSERLRGVYEARGTLDADFLKLLRDKVTQAYPNGGDEAWKAWQDGMVAHFTGRAPEGSIAADVVKARNNLGVRVQADALQAPPVQPRLFETTNSGFVLPDEQGYQALAREVSEGGNSAAFHGWLRQEIPGKTWLAEYGPRRVGRRITTSPTFTKTALGKRSSRLISYNPGRIMSYHDGASEYALLHARRWAVFNENEVRRFQSEALEILNSGSGIENKLDSLIDRVNREAFERVTAPWNLEEGFAKQLYDDVFGDTARLNSRTQAFGVKKVGDKAIPIKEPLLESQLKNFSYQVDPVAARQVLRRTMSMRQRASASMMKALKRDAPEIAAALDTPAHRAALKALDLGGEAHRAYVRLWKGLTVARPAYIVRVIGLDENARFLATSGSVTERLISWSLARRTIEELGTRSPSRKALAGLFAGERQLLDKARGVIDDFYDEVITVGDDVVTMPRPGAYDYEASAANQMRQTDLNAEIMRDAGAIERAMKATGAWAPISYADGAAKHMGAWTHDLTKQIRQSAPGRIGLESVAAGNTIEATERALVDWARADNFTTLRTRIGVDPDDVDLWASDLAAVIHSYTIGDRNIARLALEGDQKALSVFLRDPNHVDPKYYPTVHAPVVENLTNGNLWTRFQNHLYDWFVRQPEDALNRQPYYKLWKRRSEEAMYEGLRREGMKLTPEVKTAIDNASRGFALGQVRRVMFDFTKQSRFTELLQFAFPFPQPFFEGFQAWGHIAWRNPEAIGRALVIYRTATENGFFQRDPLSGEIVVPMGMFRRPAAFIYGVLGGDPKVMEEMSFFAPLSAMNMLASTTITLPGGDNMFGKAFGGVPVPVPGLDPLAANILQHHFRDDRREWVTGWLYQFGPNTPMIPNFPKTVARTIWPEFFRDSFTSSMALSLTAVYREMGLDVDENGKPLKKAEFDAMIAEAADELAAARGWIGLVAPAAVRITREGAQEDSALFQTYITEADGDYLKAVNRWLKEGRDPFTVAGKTFFDAGYSDEQNAPRVPSSQLVYQMYRTPGVGDFMRANPEWAALLLIGTDPSIAEEQDFAQYSQMIASGILKYKSPSEYLDDADNFQVMREVEKFYREVWNPGRDRVDRMGLDDQDDAYTALKFRKYEFFAALAERFPGWASQHLVEKFGPDDESIGWNWPAFGEDPDRVPTPMIRNDAWDITNVPGLGPFPGVSALRFYLEETEKIKDEMADLRITDINSTRAADAGLMRRYNRVVNETLERAPDIKPFLTNYFDVSIDNDGVVDFTGDLVYQMSEEDLTFSEIPKPLRDEVVELDSRIEAMKDNARRNFDNQYELQRGYQRVTTYLDRLYEKNPKVVEQWWKGQGQYYREDYLKSLSVKPVAFYSRWDYHLMGMEVSDQAADWLGSIAQARLDIAKAEEDDPTYSESEGYRAINTWVRERLGQDPTFDDAINAMNVWGWGLEKSGLTKTPGKVGWAWRNILRTAQDLQVQIDRLELTGTGYGTDAEKRIYDAAQDALVDRVNEYREWSPAFDESWLEVQETLGGPIIGELILPESYFGPVGKREEE